MTDSAISAHDTASNKGATPNAKVVLHHRARFMDMLNAMHCIAFLPARTPSKRINVDSFRLAQYPLMGTAQTILRTLELQPKRPFVALKRQFSRQWEHNTMSANLDMSNDRANIAFLGSRKDIWHRMGQEMAEGMSIDQWAEAAGLSWTANIVPAYQSTLAGFQPVENVNLNVRSDTGHVLGVMSDRYQNVQPRDVLEWFERYISVDDRFKLDVAGSLGQGETIWATAVFNGGMQVAGENHTARLLMSTTFDGSGSTTNQATVTRVVCNNTLNVAHGDKRAVIRTRHSTAFQPAKVAKELATIAQSFEVYKLMGDALAHAEMSREQVMNFFKDCLDIKRDAKSDDISTRKQNQYREVAASYRKSIEEGAPESSGWACLQAITRYVDHDRSSRGGESEDSARFASANFGSGSALKGEAMGLLMPLIRDRVPVLA